MRIRNGFFMREVAGKYVVVPVGAQTNEFKGMIQMNQTGAFLWKALERDLTEEALTEMMLDQYEMTEEQAKNDVHTFVTRLLEAGIFRSVGGTYDAQENGADSFRRRGIIYSGIWDQYASLHQTAEGYLASRSAGGNRGNQ